MFHNLFLNKITSLNISDLINSQWSYWCILSWILLMIFYPDFRNIHNVLKIIYHKDLGLRTICLQLVSYRDTNPSHWSFHWWYRYPCSRVSLIFSLVHLECVCCPHIFFYIRADLINGIISTSLSFLISLPFSQYFSARI